MESSARLYKLYHYLTSGLIIKFSDWCRRGGQTRENSSLLNIHTAAGGLSLQNKKKRKNYISINPFSHYVICVSRLTAPGHMRHPLKANLGENEDEFCVCLCVRTPEHVLQNDSKQSGGGKFLRFLL